MVEKRNGKKPVVKAFLLLDCLIGEQSSSHVFLQH